MTVNSANTAGNAVKGALSSAGEIFGGTTKNAASAAGTTTTGAASRAGTTWGNAVNKSTGAVAAAAAKAGVTTVNSANTAGSSVKGALSSAGSLFSGSANTAGTAFGGKVNTAGTDFSTQVSKAATALSGAATTAGTTVNNAANSAKTVLSGLTSTKVTAALAPKKKSAAGGLIPGSGTGDTVAAMLTPGEFVLTQAATKRLQGLYGPNFLNGLNKFAAGGAVGGPAAAPSPVSVTASVGTAVGGSAKSLGDGGTGALGKTVQKNLGDTLAYVKNTYGKGVTDFFGKTMTGTLSKSASDTKASYATPVQKALSDHLTWQGNTFGAGISAIYTKTIPAAYQKSAGTVSPQYAQPVQSALNTNLGWQQNTFGAGVSKVFTTTIPAAYTTSAATVSPKYTQPVQAALNTNLGWQQNTFEPGVSKIYTSTIPAAYTTGAGATNTKYVQPVQAALQTHLNWQANPFVSTTTSNFDTKVPAAFKTSNTDIGSAWSNVDTTIKTPINTVDTGVISKGLFGAFNQVEKFIGKSAAFTPIAAYARGGQIPGYGGGDVVPAMLEPGEAVVDKARTRQYAPVLGEMGVPGFAKGGIPKVNPLRNDTVRFPGFSSGGSVPDGVICANGACATGLAGGGAAARTPNGKLPGLAGGPAMRPGHHSDVGMNFPPADKLGGASARTLAAMGIPGFAAGGSVAAKALSYMNSKNGEAYSESNRWGEPPFDCSSLVWCALNAAGVPIPGGPSDNGAALANTEANWLGTWSGATKISGTPGGGDVLAFTGASPGPSNYGPIGHIGMAENANSYISAYDTASGILQEPISGVVVGFSLAGSSASGGGAPAGLTTAVPGNVSGGGSAPPAPPPDFSGLGNLQTFADDLTGTTKTGGTATANPTKALSDLMTVVKPSAGGASGPLGDMLTTMPSSMAKLALPTLKTQLAAWLKTAAATAASAAAASDTATGSQTTNGTTIYKYFRQVGWPPITAAGAIASIFGESGWNPESSGTGGDGLIGWTPPSTGPALTGNAANDMKTQLPAIIDFVNKNGDQAAVASMAKASTVLAAANIWGPDVERFGINDVHSSGVTAATSIANSVDPSAKLVSGEAAGGLMPGFGDGGTIPVLLEPGEAVIDKMTAKKHADILGKMGVPGFANGGAVAGKMLNFAEAQAGKPYSISNPFGPNSYDCAGLVYAAAEAAGWTSTPKTDVPWTSASYFGALPGAQTIGSQGSMEKADLAFFGNTGAGSQNVSIPGFSGPIGHIGIANSSNAYTSAFSGVVTADVPYNSPFAMGVRLDNVNTGGGPPPAPPPRTTALRPGNTGAAVVQLQRGLNKWAPEIGLRTDLSTNGDYNSATEAAVQDALRYFDYSAANVNAGVAIPSLQQHLWVNPPPQAKKPPPPPEFGNLGAGSTGPAVVTLQRGLDKWAPEIGLRTKIATDGDFGSSTEAAVRDALHYFDYSAANVNAGVAIPSLQQHLLVNPSPVAKKPPPPVKPPPPGVKPPPVKPPPPPPVTDQILLALMAKRTADQKAENADYALMAAAMKDHDAAAYFADSQKYMAQEIIVAKDNAAVTARQQAISPSGMLTQDLLLAAKESAALAAAKTKAASYYTSALALETVIGKDAKNSAKWKSDTAQYNWDINAYLNENKVVASDQAALNVTSAEILALYKKGIKPTITPTSSLLALIPPNNQMDKLTDALTTNPLLESMLSGAETVTPLGLAMQPVLGDLMIAETFNPSLWAGQANNAENASVEANYYAAQASIRQFLNGPSADNAETGVSGNNGATALAGKLTGIHGIDAAGRKFRSGGKLAGYGGGDKVPALLEAGEAVVDKATTKKYAGTLGKMGVPGFSAGGWIGQGGSPGSAAAAPPVSADGMTPGERAIIAELRASRAEMCATREAINRSAIATGRAVTGQLGAAGNRGYYGGGF